MSFLLLAYAYAKYGGDYHPIGRWKGEGAGFTAEWVRRHQAGNYWPSYYSPPAYATPTMYASPYAYGSGYPAYGYGGGFRAYGYGGSYPPYFGYYGQPTFHPHFAYPIRYGYW